MTIATTVNATKEVKWLSKKAKKIFAELEYLNNSDKRVKLKVRGTIPNSGGNQNPLSFAYKNGTWILIYNRNTIFHEAEFTEDSLKEAIRIFCLKYFGFKSIAD